jgi:hypothetical protein
MRGSAKSREKYELLHDKPDVRQQGINITPLRYEAPAVAFVHPTGHPLRVSRP